MKAPPLSECTYEEMLASVERMKDEKARLDLLEAIQLNPGLPFKILPKLAEMRRTDQAGWYRYRGTCDQARVPVRDLDAALDQIDRTNGANGAAPLSYTLLRDLKPNLTNNDIVKDLIPRNAFVEAHAASGGGKTAIIVDLMLHIADGRAYRGRRVVQQPVVYVALEGHGGIENRCIAAAAELGIENAPFALVKTGDNFREPAASMKVAAIAKRMLADFGGDCPIIVIDTYTAALGAGGSDCDPKDVSAFIENVKIYLLGIGCTVLINHHFGKDASRGGRGWSGLNAALDVELEIDRADDDDMRTMRVTKARDGSDGQAAFCYRFRGRKVGTDENGDEVTAVVVEHLADEDTAKRGKAHSPTARAALNKLWEMIKTPSESFPMADGLRCVISADWEKACIAPGAISNAAEEKVRRFRLRAAKQELLDAGAIVEDGGRVYPTPKSL